MVDSPLLLVTGGSGYIGSALVKEAVLAGYRIHVLDSAGLPQDIVLSEGLEKGRIRLFVGSITDSELLRKSLEGVHYTIHLAGVSDGRAGKANPALTRQVNTEALSLLLREIKAAGVQKLVFASTMGVYGNQYKGLLTEDLIVAPADPYSESKAIGEMLIKEASSNTLAVVILRIAMVYGAGVKIREDFLLNKMCQLAVQQNALSITGGIQKRPQIHLHDLNALFLKLLVTDLQSVNGTIFNVVESNPSLDEMAIAICNVLPQIDLNKLPVRENEDSFEMDSSRLREKLHFSPSLNLQAGVEQTVQYFQSIRK